MANPTSNFNWQMPTSSDLVTDLPADFEVFGQAVDTSLADLKGGTTGQVLAKASNTNMDFTWVAQDDSNAIQNAIVDAKGDLIAASANDTPARLGVGTNGQVLTADSTAATGLAWATAATSPASYGFSAGKNVILNSDFRIAQRGATFTNPTVNQYILDRWYFGGGGNLTGTISQQTFTPGAAPVAGYEGSNFLRYTGTCTLPSLLQRVEDVRTFAGQTVTLSFWAKANASLTISNVNLFQFFGSGGSAGVDNASSGIAITTSWARYSFTTTLPSISGKTIGTNSYLSVQFQFPSISSGTIDIWGVQLEANSTATTFQTATGNLASELFACQRYYFRTSGATTLYHPLTSAGFTSSTTNAVSVVQFPQPMRVAPSAVEYSAIQIQDSSGSGYPVSAVTINQKNANFAQCDFTISGATAGRFSYVRGDNSTSAYIGFNAEY